MFTVKNALLLLAGFGAAVANVNPATYDGSCWYPVGDPNFPSDNLAEYSGRWFQVAGTFALFTAGCTCIYAEYGVNPNGTISVTNVCQQLGFIPNKIHGTATPVSSSYGPAALQVSFPSVPGGGVTCPGPNYIVQKYDPQYAIVQSPKWQILFILSRVSQPAASDLESWINEAVALGTKRSSIFKISQSNCID